MKRADVNWGEVRRKYESGMYTYQRLAREYHVCTQTVWRHAIKGQWQIGREEAEKQILRRCLMATAKLLETAAAGATERLESGVTKPTRIPGNACAKMNRSGMDIIRSTPLPPPT